MSSCLDESIVCATALTGCDGRSEEECREAWGPCSEESLCIMRALEDL